MRTFTVYLILFLLPIGAVFGQDDVTECPYFNVFSSDSSGVVFPLLSTNVDATVSGVIANVVVEQTYLNAGDSVIDATYVFPMSTNAAVYGMEMILGDRTIVAEIKRKDEAQAIFEEADSAGLTASLLEQQKPNVFQMSLANINPGDSLKIRMVYTELLVPRGGVYRFMFPSIVGPRFTNGDEEWVSQSTMDYLPLSETELNIDLAINAGMSLSAECPSHNTSFNYLGNTAITSLNTNPGADFVVDYTLDDNEITTGLLLYEGEEENFFLAMIQPPRPDVPYTSPRREYVFIMDVSGSMLGTPIEVSKTLITDLLSNLDTEDRFNIVFFAGGSNILSPNSLLATEENIAAAIDMIDNQSAGGGTQLLNAMQTALDMQGTEGYSRTFAILTDGLVTVDEDAYNLIRENLNEANFFSFGIGSSINHEIIEGIAYVGEGEPFVVSNQADAYETANQFKEYIERPALTNIETTFDGINVYDLEPLTIPDVFAERPIIIYGKYEWPALGSVTLTGDYADGVVSSTLNFADYTENMEENIALKYLWARKRIKLMSDYGIASNENDTISIEEEITQLGLQYSLVTEFTSFVAVDSSAVAAPGSSSDNSGGDGTVDVRDLPSQQLGNVQFIQVLGTVVQTDEQLQIEVLPIAFEYEGLSLSITDVNGRVLHFKPLALDDGSSVISLPLDGLTAGVYFISLSHPSRVLDTAKFIVR